MSDMCLLHFWGSVVVLGIKRGIKRIDALVDAFQLVASDNQAIGLAAKRNS
jgi:hypothetical protein